jgi:caspase domain-containing protein
MSQRYAILIGSSQFQADGRLLPLRCPPKDVHGLGELIKTGYFCGKYDAVHDLVNMPQHEVMVVVNEVLHTAGKDDFVLLYYSGHGKLDKHGHLYLATSNTKLDALQATSIGIQLLKTCIDDSSCKRIALLLDCCFSGAVAQEFTKGGIDQQIQDLAQGTYILTASTGLQVAKEHPSSEYSVFTKHMIEGIKDGTADVDKDGKITFQDLYKYVHSKTTEEGHQTPMKWELETQGELVIATTAPSPESPTEIPPPGKSDKTKEATRKETRRIAATPLRVLYGLTLFEILGVWTALMSTLYFRLRVPVATSIVTALVAGLCICVNLRFSFGRGIVFSAVTAIANLTFAVVAIARRTTLEGYYSELVAGNYDPCYLIVGLCLESLLSCLYGLITVILGIWAIRQLDSVMAKPPLGRRFTLASVATLLFGVILALISTFQAPPSFRVFWPVLGMLAALVALVAPPRPSIVTLFGTSVAWSSFVLWLWFPYAPALLAPSSIAAGIVSLVNLSLGCWILRPVRKGASKDIPYSMGRTTKWVRRITVVLACCAMTLIVLPYALQFARIRRAQSSDLVLAEDTRAALTVHTDSLVKALTPELLKAGEQYYESWPMAQIAISVLGVSEIDKPTIFGLFDSEEDSGTHCWRQVPKPQHPIHLGATAWILLGMAKLGKHARADQIGSILKQQHTDGWWPVYASSNSTSENASSYATALLTLALQELCVNNLVPFVHKQAAHNAVAISRTWLAHRRIERTARWKDYPLHAKGRESLSLSGLVLHVLHRTSDLPTLPEIDRYWLDSLPKTTFNPTEHETCLDIWIPADVVGEKQDTVRHYKLSWVLIATKDAYASGRGMQRVNALKWIDQQLQRPDLVEESLFHYNWIAAELLIAFRVLSNSLAY